MLKLLFIGDIVGKPGRAIAEERVPRMRRELGLDFVIANGENAAAGAGITGVLARSLLESGIDAITLGDHVWDQRGWENEIAGIDRVCRPANLPAACPGWDHVVIESRGFKVAVFTVLGRQYMNMKAECPFLCSDRMVERLRGQADAIIVEVHAEATSEKQALGWHLDGRVTAVGGKILRLGMGLRLGIIVRDAQLEQWIVGIGRHGKRVDAAHDGIAREPLQRLGYRPHAMAEAKRNHLFDGVALVGIDFQAQPRGQFRGFAMMVLRHDACDLFERGGDI